MLRIANYILMVAAIVFATTALQACVDDPATWGPARQAHEEREFHYGPKHEVCDSYGNNCMVCDSDNDYCRRLPGSYGPYSNSGW